MSTPIPGVRYACDPTNGRWIAPGRPPLPFVPPVPVDNTVYAGSRAIGTSTYGIPPGAVYAAPLGTSSGAGTFASPYGSTQTAINNAPSGATVVLRGGTYHESLTTLSTKTVTIQAYPNEAVWFDGSSVYSSWTNNGNGTWTTTYNVVLDRFMGQGSQASLDTKYKGDPGRNLVDQAWVDETRLTQIPDATTPAAGQFSVNQTAHTLTIGTNPSGKTVRLSDFKQFLSAAGVTNFYGIGVRRYSQDKTEFGNAAAFYGGTSGGSIMEHCIWQDMSMAAFSLSKPGNIIRNVTVQDTGQAGIHATVVDDAVFDRVLVQRCNRRLWQAEPTVAGIKITRSDRVTVSNCYITDVPVAYGIWLDVSCTAPVIANNRILGAGLQPMKLGIEIELSDGGKFNGVQGWGYVVGNEVRDCSGPGVLIYDTGWIRVWNNEIDACSVPIQLRQDTRINPNAADNADTRYGNTKVPWRTVGVQIVNNNIRSGVGYNIQLLAYDDGIKEYRGGDMVDRIAGNWFRPAPPGSMAQLGQIGGVRLSYNTLAALAAAPASVGGPLDAELGENYQSLSAPANTIADPLSALIADALQLPDGTRLVGRNIDISPIPLSA